MDNTWWIWVFYGLIIFGFYFFLIRPQNKRKKQEDQMRKSAEIGDDVTTIGGIVGRVVGVKDDDDSLIIETGTDRVKMRVKRWSIGSVDTIRDEPEKKSEKKDDKADKKASKKSDK